VVKKTYMQLITVALVALLINGLLALYAQARGRVVLRQTFTADQLTEGASSGPFTVRSNNSVVRIKSTSTPKLSNEWMALDLRVVKDDEFMIHECEQDIQYYSGYDGGERWSEGGQSDSVYVKVPQKGSYRILLDAVSAGGNAVNSDRTIHGAGLVVTEGVIVPYFFIGSAVLSLVVLVLVVVAYTNWRKGDDDDEED
ncbi:hypothetical protein ACFL0Q_08840, partial [Thermodesulfobacteriota bacterium]